MHTFVIAEAGVNHNGQIELAKKLIDVAADAGCDAVKFQTFKASKLVTKKAQKADYQIKNTGNEENQYNMLKKLELSYEDHEELIKYCKERDILFLSSPFDLKAADFLDELGVELFKIPSGEIVNKPYLQHIAKKQKPIILSTGMATLGEIEEALNWIYEVGNNNVTVLHCTSDYPTKMEDVNLKAMITLKKAFKVDIGYSDHTLGIEVPIAAVTLGAKIIEKHFTLSKDMKGPDHKASLDPDELRSMVSSIRNVEMAFGDGIKKPTTNEIKTRDIVRKVIVVKENVKRDEIITTDKLTFKRAGRGLYPKYLNHLIGNRAVREIEIDEPINLKDIY